MVLHRTQVPWLSQTGTQCFLKYFLTTLSPPVSFGWRTALECSGFCDINQVSRCNSENSMCLDIFFLLPWMMLVSEDGQNPSMAMVFLSRWPDERRRSHSTLGSRQLTPPRPTPSINEKLCFLTVTRGTGLLWAPFFRRTLIETQFINLLLISMHWPGQFLGSWPVCGTLANHLRHCLLTSHYFAADH